MSAVRDHVQIQGYYETFNRENVELIDARDEQIDAFTPTGIATSAKEYKLNAVVFATASTQ